MMPKTKFSLVKTSKTYKPNAKLPTDGYREIPEGAVYGKLSNDGLKDARIYKDDFVLINTLEAVGTGDLIVILKNNDEPEIGFAFFLGGGKVKLHFANERHLPKIYKLSEIKIVGRVIRVERDL